MGWGIATILSREALVWKMAEISHISNSCMSTLEELSIQRGQVQRPRWRQLSGVCMSPGHSPGAPVSSPGGEKSLPSLNQAGQGPTLNNAVLGRHHWVAHALPMRKTTPRAQNKHQDRPGKLRPLRVSEDRILWLQLLGPLSLCVGSNTYFLIAVAAAKPSSLWLLARLGFCFKA